MKLERKRGLHEHIIIPIIQHLYFRGETCRGGASSISSFLEEKYNWVFLSSLPEIIHVSWARRGLGLKGELLPKGWNSRLRYHLFFRMERDKKAMEIFPFVFEVSFFLKKR